ncbi:AraC family transcriptional regulator [Priestia taiwanensis]|uniref:AraC family transcriptional regulator n=1 Tax=Priestia taiwanensis TaxID=1347902 RepID=A0A917AX14_9BACI|nr:AraC family transcriptional regulator [Priestia taiwanensis]MBM7365259.1 AraC family transcriptional regulator [Priestia taiwanensis]GGE85753.1 AraC family transcriptional regulator [Priestia taiwanensis]
MLHNLNNVLDYIETHLDQTIDFHDIEKIVGISEYHFRRVFSFLSGMSLHEYIRHRRLSNAAFELQKGKTSVTEMAFKYGYHSVDGFSRSFKDWCGTNPSEIKKTTHFKAFPKLTFQLTIQGGIDMEYQIEEKKSFKMVGLQKRVPIVFDGINLEIQQLAKSITQAQREQLRTFANIHPHSVMNASFNFDEGRMQGEGHLDHIIGVISTLRNEFEGFDVIEVPALTWAVFSSQGEFPKVMQESWGKIYSEWLPSSDYELVEAPEISFTGDLSDLANVRSEIWIAVRKKK